MFSTTFSVAEDASAVFEWCVEMCFMLCPHGPGTSKYARTGTQQIFPYGDVAFWNYSTNRARI